MKKIKIGIMGYGNIGKGVEKAVDYAYDMELVAVFTHRNPKELAIVSQAKVMSYEQATNLKDKIDVMILCGGTSADLPEQGPKLVHDFNTVDSFDTHTKIPEYMANIDRVAKNSKKTAIISAGWDPGLFSIMRALGEAVLPDGNFYTFWGRGVSQGHTFAIRHIEGVKNGIQYSIPIDSAVEEARSGRRPHLSARQRLTRECYVVAHEGADKEKIEHEIKIMPEYFADYDTTVTFISEQKFVEEHSTMPHGGRLITSGNTGTNSQIMEFSLKLESNPEFTASVMVAYARAAFRLSNEGQYGAKTVLDIPLTYLSEKDRDILIKELL